MFTFKDLQREIPQQHRTKWEELWTELLRADGPQAGIDTQDIHWDDRDSMRDGGCDITISRGSQRGKQPLIPLVPSIWSVKSGKNGLSPATLAKELEPKSHPEIAKCLATGGLYFYCVCYPATEAQIRNLKERARKVEVAHGFAANSVTILQPSDLVAHLKRRLGVVRTFCPRIGESLGDSMDQWGQQARPIFDPTIAFVDIGGRGATIATLVDHLKGTNDPSVIHVAGLSGIGKTRLVHEACRQSGLEGSIQYFPNYAAVIPMLQRIRNDDCIGAVLVVDECSFTNFSDLLSKLDAARQRIRVISIGPASAGDKSREGVIVLSQPVDADVLKLLKSEAGDGFDTEILKVLSQECGHDLRFALQLWNVVKGDPSLATDRGRLVEMLRHPKLVLDRVLDQFGHEVGDRRAFLDQYRWMTLGRQVGWRPPRRKEIDYLAILSGVGEQAMDDMVAKARRCGLGETPAHLFEAVPRGMATLIFSSDLWPVIKGRFDQLFANAPSDSFRHAIMQRAEMCNEHIKKEVRSRVDLYFLNTLGAQGLKAMIARGDARLVRSWIELSPEAGLSWLTSAINAATVDELKEFRGSTGELTGGLGPRRQVMWAVTHLACFHEYYEVCEHILFRLAVAENEEIGNNATGKWRERLRIEFSNVQTPYPARMDILMRRLEAAQPATAPLLLKGLVEAVSWPNSAMSPPPVIGGRLVPEEWRPVGLSVYDLFVSVIRRAIGVMTNWPEEMQRIARDKIIKHFDGFCNEGTVDVVRVFCANAFTDQAQRGPMREAVEEFVASQKRAGTPESHQLATRVGIWLDQLKPRSDVEMIQATVNRAPWDYDQLAARREEMIADNEMAWVEPYAKAAVAIRSDPSVLVTLEEWLNGHQGDGVASLGQKLAEHADITPIRQILQRWLHSERCGALCVGFCSQYRSMHGQIPPWATVALNSEVNSRPEYAARMTSIVDPTVPGFERIMRCVDAPGVSKPRALGRLYGNHWKPVLDADRQKRVLDHLLPAGTEPENEAVHIAVRLLRLYLHGEKTTAIPVQLRDAVRRLVTTPPAQTTGYSEHDWKGFAKRLANTDAAFVLKASVALAVGNRESRGFARREAVEVLEEFCKEYQDDVMREVLAAIRADEGWRPLRPRNWQRVFSLFNSSSFEKLVLPWGEDFARRIGQLMPDATLGKDGEAVVPSITAWYLSRHGADDECYRQFSKGRWNGRTQSGRAWERSAQIEREAKAFGDHPIAALRRWSAERLEDHKREVDRARIDYEEMNNRG